MSGSSEAGEKAPIFNAKTGYLRTQGRLLVDPLKKPQVWHLVEAEPPAEEGREIFIL